MLRCQSGYGLYEIGTLNGFTTVNIQKVVQRKLRVFESSPQHTVLKQESMDACLLDLEVFTCCRCGKEFDHKQGTWLPIGIEDKSNMLTTGSLEEPPIVLHYSDMLRKPEIITSDEFTCYDCCP
jgi:hypothetical protein